jgi:hypothetical protein
MELSQIPAMLVKAMKGMSVAGFDDILVIHDKKLA